MSVINKYYLAAPSVAERTGLIKARYRVRDGRFVLHYADMKFIRFTPEELIGGIGTLIEEVAKAEAERLIAENGYRIGPDDGVQPIASGIQVEAEQESPAAQDATETETENETETPNTEEQ